MKSALKLSALALALAGCLGSAQASVVPAGAVFKPFSSPGPFAPGSVLADNPREAEAPAYAGILRTAAVQSDAERLDVPYRFERTGGGAAGSEEIGTIGVAGLGDSSRQTLVGEQPDGSVAEPPEPEPKAYAMVLAGLGLLGVIARRRRQATDGL